VLDDEADCNSRRRNRRVGCSAAAQETFSAVHRCRYALVEETAGVAFLWDDEIRLGACGDWCLGPRVEAAFDSGEALAEAIQQTQGANLVV